MSPKPDRERILVERYGLLLSLKDVAETLRYPSLQAARKAILRGKFPIPLVRMPPRRGWFATASVVAAFLDSLEQPSGAPAERRPDPEEDRAMS